MGCLCLLISACSGGADVDSVTDAQVAQSRVAASTDDVEETPTGSVTRSSADLDLVIDEDGVKQRVGLRFTDVDVPRGARITDAYVGFTAEEASSEATTLTIRGVAADDAATFISARFNVSSQTTTAASVAWSPPPWTTAGVSGPEQKTVNLTPIVQEIIDRPGWSRGGALALTFTGTGRRVAESFDGSPEKAPRLVVSFTFDESVNVETFTARPVDARAGQDVTFSWSVTDAQGDAVSCHLDVNGDGAPDYDIADCLATKTQSHTYPVAGHYAATLTVTDGGGAAATTTAEVAVTTPHSVTVAAAGDIACDPEWEHFNGGLGTADKCHMKATSDLLLTMKPDAVLTLGDNQYDDATLKKFMQSYDPTWGRLKRITYPALGTHEYESGSAAGYFAYFGAAAGNPSRGYYSFDLGAWHIVVLNTSCSRVGGCGSGSPQERWLRADLAANPKACTLAVMKLPLFSSGEKRANTGQSEPLWRAAYEAGAELVLSGSDHLYERFAPQTPDGALDTARGVRQFVVGTGGKSLHSFFTVQSNSQARVSGTYGVLKLTLNASSYSWTFVPEAGKTATDSGTSTCH